MKDPKKVEAGKRLAAHNHKRREKQREEQVQKGGVNQLLRNWSCSSCGGDRWSWLLHLSNQERTSQQRSQYASLPTTMPSMKRCPCGPSD